MEHTEQVTSMPPLVQKGHMTPNSKSWDYSDIRNGGIAKVWKTPHPHPPTHTHTTPTRFCMVEVDKHRVEQH